MEGFKEFKIMDFQSIAFMGKVMLSLPFSNFMIKKTLRFIARKMNEKMVESYERLTNANYQ